MAARRTPATAAGTTTEPATRRPRTAVAARPRRATTSAEPPVRRTRTASTRRRVAVVPVRLVEDDAELLAAEHDARDAQLLDLLGRLSA